MKQERFDVVVLGGGPAGLAAALAAEKSGASVLLAEREGRLGGILKQCIHDGFGLVRFGKKMAGPEYAQHFIDAIKQSNVEISLLSFATDLKKDENGVHITLVTRSGMRCITAKSLVLATGCRERTARQIAIHGTRPAGVLTAGAAQYYTNVLGQLPTQRCVILGSGDIGLIMARRLTLEGAQVLGVYEAKPTPSGLARNISQCLTDFDIPLHLGCTVTRVFGAQRLTAVEIAHVDAAMQPIEGTQQVIACDSLILSVGLIPENELAERLNLPLEAKTKGPVCDQQYETMSDGIFVCGNALHVNDLVDYVSESGEGAGAAAAQYAQNGHAARRCVPIACDDTLLYNVPQCVDLAKPSGETVLFFRSKTERSKTKLVILCGEKTLLTKTYRALRPPEMERIVVDFSALNGLSEPCVTLHLQEVE